MNVGEALLNALKNAGARALFGIPGDYVLPFFNVIEESSILPLYTLSHEPSVGYAADAAARYGGDLGVAVVTYGAGALNMVNAVACAWAERSPLVIISGAPGGDELERGLLLHHQIRRADSQLRIFEEITCARAVLDDPKTAPKEIARVLQACLRHSRPVYIELPRNISQTPCLPVAHFFEKVTNEAPIAPCAEAIKRKLAKAKHPVILADAEVRRFGLENAIAALSARTGIPLVTTLMGKGLFAGQQSPCRGTYLGTAGDGAIRELVENADCLLMLGVIISDTNLGAAGKKIDLSKAIQINEGNVVVGKNKFKNINSAALIETLQDILPTGRSALAPVRHIKIKTPAEDKLLRADDIAGLINAQLKTMSEKTPVAVDVGDCLFISMGLNDISLLASGFYATMGFGVPAGLGVQASTGDRPLIITGDGGFQMTGWELLNCVRSGLDPVVLVLNNGGWGMLKQFHQQAGYTSRGDIPYALLAKTLGGDGYRVTTTGALAAALQKAFRQRGRFQLIEAVLPGEDVSTALKSYIGAMKEGMAPKIVA